MIGGAAAAFAAVGAVLTLVVLLGGGDKPSSPDSAPPNLEGQPHERTDELIYAGVARSRGMFEVSGVVALADQAKVQIAAFEIDLTAAGVEIVEMPPLRIVYLDTDHTILDLPFETDQAGADDAKLEPGERVRITIDLRLQGVSLRGGEVFVLEVVPDKGSFLVIERNLPYVLQDINTLD